MKLCKYLFFISAIIATPSQVVAVEDPLESPGETLLPYKTFKKVATLTLKGDWPDTVSIANYVEQAEDLSQEVKVYSDATCLERINCTTSARNIGGQRMSGDILTITPPEQSSDQPKDPEISIACASDVEINIDGFYKSLFIDQEQTHGAGFSLTLSRESMAMINSLKGSSEVRLSASSFQDSPTLHVSGLTAHYLTLRTFSGELSFSRRPIGILDLDNLSGRASIFMPGNVDILKIGDIEGAPISTPTVKYVWKENMVIGKGAVFPSSVIKPEIATLLIGDQKDEFVKLYKTIRGKVDDLKAQRLKRFPPMSEMPKIDAKKIEEKEDS